MTVNLNDQQILNIIRAHGLNQNDAKQMAAFRAEFAYATEKAAQQRDPKLAQGNVDHLLSQAAARTAERLHVQTRSGPRLQSDSRDPRQRFLDSLTPEERAHAEAWQNGGRTSEAEAQRQQAHLRARFLDEVNDKAVDPARGRMLLDRSLAYLQNKYRSLGLNDVQVSREDVGQLDVAGIDHMTPEEQTRYAIHATKNQIGMQFMRRSADNDGSEDRAV